MIVWIASGSLFGVTMSFVSNRWVSKRGTFLFYDRAAKITLLVGLIGYFLMGLSYEF